MSKTPTTGIYSVSRELVDEFDGLSAKQIRKMPMSEYARRTGRQIDYAPEAATPATPEQQPERHPVIQQYIDATENSGSGVITFEDLQGMSLVEYARARKQLGMGVGSGEGRGILNPVAQGDLNEGVRRNAGRGALSNNNVSMPPRIDINSRLTKDNEPPTGRNDSFSLFGN